MNQGRYDALQFASGLNAQHMLALQSAVATHATAGQATTEMDAIKTVPSEALWFNAPCVSEQKCMVRLENVGSRRLGYTVAAWKQGAFETETNRRYNITSGNGVLLPDEKAILLFSVNAFGFEPHTTTDDHLVIRWFDVPEEANFYSDQDMLGAKVFYQKSLPIMYNP